MNRIKRIELILKKNFNEWNCNVIDVSTLSSLACGDEVVLIGRQGVEKIAAEQDSVCHDNERSADGGSKSYQDVF